MKEALLLSAIALCSPGWALAEEGSAVLFALFQLNSLDLKADRPIADGVVRGWFDGKLEIDRNDVVLRSTDFPKMKFNQFLLLPYFGPGLLPHAQTVWIDDLVLGTKRLSDGR